MLILLRSGEGGSTLTLTPAPGALTLAGSAPRLYSALRPAAGAMTLAGATPRLHSALRPAAGALTLGQGAAPSLGGAAETGGFFALLLVG